MYFWVEGNLELRGEILGKAQILGRSLHDCIGQVMTDNWKLNEPSALAQETNEMITTRWLTDFL